MNCMADSVNGPLSAKIFGASVSMLKLSTQGTKASLSPGRLGIGPAVVITVPAWRSVPPVIEFGSVVKMNGSAPPPSVRLSDVLPGNGKSGPIFQMRQPEAAIPGSQNQPAYRRLPRESRAPPNTCCNAVTCLAESWPVPDGPSDSG